MAAAAGLFLHRPYLLLSILFLSIPPLTYSLSEVEALLKFKRSLTNANALASWDVPGSLPCSKGAEWVGLMCSNKGIVEGLSLGGMGLSGKPDFTALNDVKGVLAVGLMNNNFSGSIPDFNVIGPLKAIYLSGNEFSGEIPSDFFSKMDSLKKVWLDHNKFSGKIPVSLAERPNLQELHLENNQFSGSLPELSNKLKSFNVSNNKFEGEIPKSLSRFDKAVFSGNSDLCGSKVGKECEKAVGTPASAPTPVPSPTISSNENNEGGGSKSSSKSKGSSSTVVIALSVTCAVVLLILIILLFARSKRKKADENFDTLGIQNSQSPDRPPPPPQETNVEAVAVELNVEEINTTQREVVVKPSAPVSTAKKVGPGRKSTSNHAKGGGGLGELVMLNEEKGVFGLTDLMKAAAEVLGNGGMGSSYKAVLANGLAVVVKRIRENAMGREAFDAEMRKLGTLRHRNLLTPLAYHYRKEEKLLIYEYIPKGSLVYLLHGERGTSHDQLDWHTRLTIIQGIARGMGFIHTQFSGYDLPHGDLKSSNVLIGPDYEPLLSEFAFAPMVNSSILPQALFAYKAPEALEFGQVSPKCDVFCLGVIILETLTGKFPSQYLNNGKGGIDVVQWVRSAISERRELELLDPEISNEKGSISEMEKLLHIGAACTENDPRQRLDMMEAIRRIEQIKAVGASEEAARIIQVPPSLRDGVAGMAEPATAEAGISRTKSTNFRSSTG